MLSVWAGPSAADALGDLIAETLCYPGAVTVLSLAPAEAAAYRRSKTLSGRHRDAQGSDARARFEKTPAGAFCRADADFAGTLSFCWPVTLGEHTLRKDRARLCP